MDDRNQDLRTAIAAEAVGERAGSETPDAAAEKAKLRSEEAVRAVATTPPSHANTADIAAEAVGERVGDAYANATIDEARERSRQVVRPAATAGSHASSAANDVSGAGRQVAQLVSDQFDQQPFLMAVSGFILGYITGFLIHRRR
jgi:hypothetical protein